MNALLQEVRYAIRTVRHAGRVHRHFDSHGRLSIGANTAMFSVVYTRLLAAPSV